MGSRKAFVKLRGSDAMMPRRLTRKRGGGGWARAVLSAWLPAIAVVGGCGFELPTLPRSERPAPKFQGQSIPDAPSQAAPWTLPTTRLPRYLTEATGALFE